VRLEQTADGFPRVSMARALGGGNRGCPVVFYLDGIKLNATAGLGTELMGREKLEAVLRLSPSQIEGVEVYKGAAQLPAEFGGSDAECGVIAVWTRREP